LPPSPTLVLRDPFLRVPAVDTGSDHPTFRSPDVPMDR